MLCSLHSALCSAPLPRVSADVRMCHVGQDGLRIRMPEAPRIVPGKPQEPEVHGRRDSVENHRRSPRTLNCNAPDGQTGHSTCSMAAGLRRQRCNAGHLRTSSRTSHCRPTHNSRGARRLSASTCAAACLLMTVLPLQVWAAPAVVSPRNAPVSGGHTITITGTNVDDFGLGLSYPKVRIGGTAAPATAWVSKTTITATLPPGTLLAQANVVHCDDSTCLCLCSAILRTRRL